MSTINRKSIRRRIHNRIRRKVSGTAERPRLAVHYSNQHIYAQLIDETLPESQRNPDVYLNNWRLAFDRLKQATFANGRFIYCAGSDWINYGYGNAHILPIGIFAATKRNTGVDYGLMTIVIKLTGHGF